jgi:hypothetical protein
MRPTIQQVLDDAGKDPGFAPGDVVVLSNNEMMSAGLPYVEGERFVVTECYRDYGSNNWWYIRWRDGGTASLLASRFTRPNDPTDEQLVQLVGLLLCGESS